MIVLSADRDLGTTSPVNDSGRPPARDRNKFSLAAEPKSRLRLRLPAHDFDRLMQAAKPAAEADRDAMLKDIAAKFGRHEVLGPGLLHRIISDAQRRYDVADQRHATG